MTSSRPAAQAATKSEVGADPLERLPSSLRVEMDDRDREISELVSDVSSSWEMPVMMMIQDRTDGGNLFLHPCMAPGALDTNRNGNNRSRPMRLVSIGDCLSAKL